MDAHERDPAATHPHGQHAREFPADTGHELARPVELDRLWQESGQQIRRILPCDAIAIALIDEATGEPRVALNSGYGEPDAAVAGRLGAIWRATAADGRARLDVSPDGPELTVPIPGERAPLGTITVRYDTTAPPPNADHAESVLAAVAAQIGVGVERARDVERLVARRAIESAARVAAGLANELRNPLFGISSAAQLLRYRAREDPVIERNAGRILRDIEHLNGVVAELLEYGTPHPPRLATVDPDAVWDEVLEGNRGLLESRSLSLDRHRPEHAVKLHADAGRLAQLFLGLLRNAVEAATPGSTVALRSRRLADGSWRCALWNEGEPIPADALPRVFELFFSTRPGASGVGLAISERIVHEHHGTIAIESAAERGTTVTVTLPAHH